MEAKKLTKEQIIFRDGKARIDYLKNLEKVRKLTPAERQEVKDIQMDLYNYIIRYGKYIARTMMKGYNLKSDAYEEVDQEIALKFFEKLESYDPLRTTPTTYFVSYFREVVNNYLNKFSQNLSQYDAHNVSKVRSAINYWESKGIMWTLDLIETTTGLSPKVILRTLNIAQNSKQANIDDVMNVASQMPTPEEAYIEKERKELLKDRMLNSLTPEELNVLIVRVNEEGSKELPFDKVAEVLNIQTKDAKKLYSRAIAKLQADKGFRKEADEKNAYEEGLKLQDNSSDILEIQMLSFLDDSDDV